MPARLGAVRMRFASDACRSMMFVVSPGSSSKSYSSHSATGVVHCRAFAASAWIVDELEPIVIERRQTVTLKANWRWPSKPLAFNERQEGDSIVRPTKVFWELVSKYIQHGRKIVARDC